MGRDRRPQGFLAAAAACLVVLAACTAGPELERDPQPSDREPASVDVSEMRVPTGLTGFGVVDPGWVTPAQYADGVYLGAGQQDGHLEFTAIDTLGEVLWSAERPASCTGFALTRDDQGRALAILTDTETTEEALAGTSVSAYELATGEHVWGPVEVPGPHQGPGLVFAAPPGEAMGDTGPRTALDPSTGDPAVSEQAEPGVRVLGEFDGLVLLADEGRLIARHAGDGSELWRLTREEHGWDGGDPAVPAAAGSLPGLTLLTAGDRTDLVDLHTGAVRHEGAGEAVVDPTSGTLLVLDGSGVHAYDGEELLWQAGVSPETSIESAGGVLLYLRDGDAIRVHNAVTGAVAQGYDPQGSGTILVPEHFSATGAGLLRDGGRQLLAVLPEAPIMDGAP